LNRLPKVREFINTHANKFDLEINYVGKVLFNFYLMFKGGDPRLVFFDQGGSEALEINISNYDSEGIMKLLEEKGFKQKPETVAADEL
jgi:hypothetical protein